MAATLTNTLPGRDTKAHAFAAVSTLMVATVLLLLLWLIKIVTPLPPIPPDPEPPTLEFEIGEAGGGWDVPQGGGSQGETGLPGMQASSDDVSDGSPTQDGSITDDASDNAPSNTSTTPATQQPKEPTVSESTRALMEKLKNKKSNTSIQIGGDGSGSPYSSGKGDGNGPGVGPGDGGTPGTGPGTGGGPGGDGPGGGKRFRKILSKPEIVNPTQEEGTVVVNVYVDRSGAVKRAEVRLEGTTTANSILRSTATQSAYKIRFDEDKNGPELLVLPIEINFTLK